MVKKRTKYKYDVNRRALWKKKKRVPKIQCEQLAESWDYKKSVKRNLADMGLAANPNDAVPIPRTKVLPEEFAELPLKKAATKTKTKVVKDMEAEASRPTRSKQVTSTECDALFATYMLDKHGEDFVAMARDRMNSYQDTPAQLRKKINRFKASKRYQTYLASKEENT